MLKVTFEFDSEYQLTEFVYTVNKQLNMAFEIEQPDEKELTYVVKNISPEE